MPDPTHQRYSHKTFDPAPWPISEPNHCITVFEKLRLQREQGRFCDVILKVSGRDFPAHRCVLASCSSRFDTMFKVHKTMKEIIEVENCKNYEVFHLVLTYMYTGKISLDKHTVADILEIAHVYTIGKLKSYCSEFLERHYLRPKDCLTAVELSVKYHLADLQKQTQEFIHKNFKQVVKYHDIERMSLTKLQEYLNHSWWFPPELVLRIIIRWISQDLSRREENFVQLFHNVVNEQTISSFVTNHLDKEEKEIYQDLQDRFLPEYQEIAQELEDNTSFLSIAFSAVKDLENQEVDESFSSYILQPEETHYGSYRQHNPSLESGLMVMDSPYASSSHISSNPSHSHPKQTLMIKSGQADESDKNIPLENSQQNQFLSADEDLKVPMRIVTDPGYIDHTNSMMFSHSSKVIMTPHNSAASSPIPSAVPSPINVQMKYREAQDQDICLDTYKQTLVMNSSSGGAEYFKPDHGGHHEGQAHACSSSRSHMSDMYQGGQSLSSGGHMYREGREEYGQEMYRGGYTPTSAMDSYRSNSSCLQNYDPYRMNDTESLMQRQQQDFGHNFREVSLMQEEKSFNNQNQDGRLSLNFNIDEYPIIEQFINEEVERTKYSSTKRYDPKHRALAQAFRKKDISHDNENNAYISKQSSMESCSINKVEQIGFDNFQENIQCKIESPTNPSHCQYSSHHDDDRGNSQLQASPVLSPSQTSNSVVGGYHVDSVSTESNMVTNIEDDTKYDRDQYPTPAERSYIGPDHQSGEHSPRTSLQFSVCVQDPLLTPEKTYVYNHGDDTDHKRNQRSEPQQLFLTPKEKYAKELSAQIQVPQPAAFIDIHQESDTGKTDCGSSDYTTTQIPQKKVYPSAIKILKSKKKMASQKRLILEHGEVRLSQRQRLRIKRKKPRKLRAKDIFQPAPVDETPAVEETQFVDCDSQNADDVPKKIINRKDKLLAEHRAEHQNQVLSEMEDAEKKKNNLKCDKCSFSCNTQKKLKVHEKVHKEDKQFVCPFCSTVTYWIKDHYNHIQAKHIPGSPPYKCPRCSYQNSKLKQVIAHQTCHSEAMPFSCSKDNCNFKTKLMSNLKKHERNHSNQKFICPICEKSFGHKYTMEQHKAVHSDEKKFKCKLCTYSTKYSSHLAAHRRVHEGRVHRCTFDGCQYWTPKGTLLKAHIRAHNGDKCFKCKTCGKGFVEAGQLRRHVKIHSTEKPFACNIDNCSYVTNRRDKLKEHQGRSHKPKETLEQPELTVNKRPSKIIYNNPPSPSSPATDTVNLNFSQI